MLCLHNDVDPLLEAKIWAVPCRLWPYCSSIKTLRSSSDINTSQRRLEIDMQWRAIQKSVVSGEYPESVSCYVGL
jgi:hypothetical protein